MHILGPGENRGTRADDGIKNNNNNNNNKTRQSLCGNTMCVENEDRDLAIVVELQTCKSWESAILLEVFEKLLNPLMFASRHGMQERNWVGNQETKVWEDSRDVIISEGGKERRADGREIRKINVTMPSNEKR